MTTIVSSFISNINKRNDKSFETYIQYGILLAKARIPKIFFLDIEWK